jgi:hypothetical protein
MELTGRERQHLSECIDDFEAALAEGDPQKIGWSRGILDEALGHVYEEEGEADADAWDGDRLVGPEGTDGADGGEGDEPPDSDDREDEGDGEGDEERDARSGGEDQPEAEETRGPGGGRTDPAP